MCAGTVWGLWGTEWVLGGLFGVTLGLGSGETALLKKEVRFGDERGCRRWGKRRQIVMEIYGVTQGCVMVGTEGSGGRSVASVVPSKNSG